MGKSAAARGFTAKIDAASQRVPNPSPATAYAWIVLGSRYLSIDLSYQGLLGDAIGVQLHGPTTISGRPGFSNPSLTAALVDDVDPATAILPLPHSTSGEVTKLTADLLQPSSWDPDYLAAHGGTPQTALASLNSGVTYPVLGRVYVSIKTTAYPNGELRGFLIGFPEPSSAILAVSGMSVMLAFRRRFSRHVATHTPRRSIPLAASP